MNDLEMINSMVIDLIRKITKDEAVMHFNMKPEVYDAIIQIPEDKVYVLKEVKQLLIKVTTK